MNLNLLQKDLKKLPLLITDFFFMSIGLVLLKNSMFGLDPWGVFHEGLNIVTGIPFGQTIVLLGYVILVFSIFIKIYPGFGTVLNILLIGNFVDLILNTGWFVPETFLMRIVYFIVGFVLFNIGKSIYIGLNLGAGPRDGLFVGLVRLTKIDVKYIKPIIEITVLAIGIFLGGTFGVGTIINALFSGWMIGVGFKLIKFDPSKKAHSALHHYFMKST